MKAFITGISGQDGSYLTELLLSKGYQVYGLIRNQRTCTQYLPISNENLTLLYGDITDHYRMMNVIMSIKPDEVYHLASDSFVSQSFDSPISTQNTNYMGTLNIILAVKELLKSQKVRLYNACTSEIFGNGRDITESHITAPCSPYGVSKLAALHLCRMYRDAYGMFIANGILFNHESERRGKDFVTMKIVRGIRALFQDKRQVLYLGNIYAYRDWGYAQDYVQAMWLMLQHYKADDFVVATGRSYSIQDFVIQAFELSGLAVEFMSLNGVTSGVVVGIHTQELNEKFSLGDVVVKVDPSLFRAKDIDHLSGCSNKIQDALGWKATTDFKALVKFMLFRDPNETYLYHRA